MVDYEIVEEKINVIDIVSELNLPGMLEVNEVTVQFYANKVQPYAVKAYSVVPCKKIEKVNSSFNNEFIDFELSNNSIVLVDKVANKKYLNPFYIEDEADKGDAYVFYPSSCDKKVIAYPNSCSLVFENKFKKTVLLKFEYDYPEEFDFANNKCKQSFKKQSCNLYLSLLKDSKIIEMNLEFDNKCKDHRVRFCIDCGFNNEGLMTDSPFDYIVNKKYDCGDVSDSFTHCNSTFVYSENDNIQALFCTEGLYEVENFDGKIAFTIVRSTGRISYDYDFIGDNFKCSENQTIRQVNHRIGMSFGKLTPSECFITAKQFRIGCLTIADSYDVRKYAGGRFAVQSTSYSEFYYLEDEYKDISSNDKKLFNVTGENVVVSAVKCDYDGNLILRLLNFSEKDTVAHIEFDGKIALSNMIEDLTTDIEQGKKSISLKKKEIVTLKLIKR